MQCDRAQEFFSDYLERTLDRPMTIALESHLAGCAACREELEGLQAVCLALDAVPEVEPPADGAWQVIRAVHNSRPLVEPQRRAPGFLEWLRSLSPMSVGLSAGLATLVVAGLVFWSPKRIDLTIIPVPGRTNSAATAAKLPWITDSSPSIQVQQVAGGQFKLLLTTASDMPDAEIRVSGEGIAPKVARGSLRRGDPQECPVEVVPGAAAQALHVVTHSANLNVRYEQTVIVPMSQNTDPVTVSLVEQPLEQVLVRLAPNLGAVVVVDGNAANPVTLQAGDQPALRCLQDVAEKAHLRLKNEANGVIHLIP